jgi:hypothetical protein
VVKLLLGRVAGHSPKARAPQAEKQRRHAAEAKAWNPSDQPDWLTEEVYREKIQPRLARITVRAISSALGLSEPYAAEIRAGRQLPHSRHWLTLAACDFRLCYGQLVQSSLAVPHARQRWGNLARADRPGFMHKRVQGGNLRPPLNQITQTFTDLTPVNSKRADSDDQASCGRLSGTGGLRRRPSTFS